jgi:predicted PhzF superfamily epimerase YddE/YHI9
MPVLHVLRVFCDSERQFGSPLGVVLDGPAIPPERRQSLAAELGFTETVYVDDPETGQLRIFTPAAELPGYGVPQDEACGSASMLLAAQLGRAITIQHGSGSLVQASPAPNGMADLGGYVVWDHERALD